MKNITDRILPNQNAADELEVFLGTRGDSTQAEQRKIAYESGRLIVEYTARHQISSICVADDYGESMIRKLERDVAEALSQGDKEVAQRYLHSLYATDGFYSHKDRFQILPSPPDAPQPDFAYAQHSFLLEYSFPKSPHQLVNQHRSSRRFSELSLLLNALLRAIQLPNSSTTHEWVVTSGPEWASCYLQLGYFGGTEYRAKRADGFSSTEGLSQLEMVDVPSYYTSLGVDSGKPLQLPTTFTESLAAYDKLDEESKTKFCRASYWSHVSSRVFAVSQSAAFAALVSAVEVFLPEPVERCTECGRPTSADRCESCNQPIAGPTRQFREFVERYAPGVPARDRNRLYSRRSSLSHGSSLLPRDLSEIGFRFTPETTEAWSERQLLSQIVQLVLINWLNSPS